MDITIYLAICATMLAVGSWCAFVWAVRGGQFENVEEIKYRVVENEIADNEEARAGNGK